jgi:uncharacterized protein (DUF1330 family)
MAKGYWIAHVDVRDPDTYKSYVNGIQAALAAHGGRYLVRAGQQGSHEGGLRPRSVVIEFPSLAAAQACYDSPAYMAARKFRLAAAEADLVIIEGYDGAQPGGA